MQFSYHRGPGKPQADSPLLIGRPLIGRPLYIPISWPRLTFMVLELLLLTKFTLLLLLFLFYFDSTWNIVFYKGRLTYLVKRMGESVFLELIIHASVWTNLDSYSGMILAENQDT